MRCGRDSDDENRLRKQRIECRKIKICRYSAIEMRTCVKQYARLNSHNSYRIHTGLLGGNAVWICRKKTSYLKLNKTKTSQRFLVFIIAFVCVSRLLFLLPFRILAIRSMNSISSKDQYSSYPNIYIYLFVIVRLCVSIFCLFVI